jgi:hypothetical protein
MSFLDNLENNIKAMESHEERGNNRDRDHVRREAERARVRAIAPFAEQLRKGPFTTDLLNEATRIAHGLRTKVYMTWIESTLRLEAREHRLELKATPDGVLAQYYVNKEPTRHEVVDLNSSARKLAEKWLATVGPRPQVAAVE